MIQIEDNDSPIMAAYKIIHGIKAVSWTPASKLGYILATGKTPKEGRKLKWICFRMKRSGRSQNTYRSI